MEARTVPELLTVRAQKDPEQVAVIVDGVSADNTMTYQQWDKQSNALGRVVSGKGICPGDRVALLLSNRQTLAFLIAYFAIHKAGGVVVPINTRLTASEIGYILSNSEAKGVIAESAVMGVLKEAQKNTAFPTWVIEKDDATEGAAGVGWASLISENDDGPFLVERGQDELADIIYTSGTTGFPKGVACTHGNIVGLGKGANMELLFAKKCFLHAIPYFTFAGLHMMLLMPVKAGLTSIVQAKFDPPRYLALIEEHKVALAYAVPSMILLMLNDDSLGNHNYDSLQLMMYGTAPMPPHGVRKLGDHFRNTMLVNLYGLTEGGATTCSLSAAEVKERPDSVGKPTMGAELRIVKDDGETASPDEVGEIWMWAESRRRYFNNEEATKETWTGDGWLKTGDLGYVDTDGYLYLAGRKKDMIIRGGFNIYPIEIESVLHDHPDVKEVAVVGIPHGVLGEDIKAFVVPGGENMLDEAKIKEFCAEKLADYKIPRQVELIKELPRNALGKVLKRVLREDTGEDQSGTGLGASV